MLQIGTPFKSIKIDNPSHYWFDGGFFLSYQTDQLLRKLQTDIFQQKNLHNSLIH